jgi:hypothetical protein
MTQVYAFAIKAVSVAVARLSRPAVDQAALDSVTATVASTSWA